MTLKDQLFKDLRPEYPSETTSLDKAIDYLKRGGTVIHNGQEVDDLYKLSFGSGFGRYKGYLSGDWMNGIFILK